VVGEDWCCVLKIFIVLFLVVLGFEFVDGGKGEQQVQVHLTR